MSGRVSTGWMVVVSGAGVMRRLPAPLTFLFRSDLASRAPRLELQRRHATRTALRLHLAIQARRGRRWFRAVTELVAREDRVAERQVFQGFGADRFRTAMARACKAAGVPVFSPHDLRHRRISLLNLAGVPGATIGQHVGQRDLAVTANTYTPRARR